LNWEVRRVEASNGREFRLACLVEVDRFAEIFEPMRTQIADRRSRLEEFTRRPRDQNLPTMSGRGDPRRPMHINPAVVAVNDQGLTRV
jgi:hypothetical protein